MTGLSDAGTGVAASTASGYGVYATAGGGVGVYATADTGIAVLAVSQEQDAVNGTSAAPGHAGVSGVNTAAATGRVPSAIGVYANSNNTGLLAQGDPAGYFAGDVLVTGDVVMLNANSADIAEEFDCAASAEPLEPGTVVVIDPDGRLAAGEDAYDTRVAGVVSGGGTLKPALLLQSFDSSRPRSPIALLGKVYCKVDAGYAPIVAGDLLTTSQTRGHAMKATDRNRALGAVIGKALESVSAGSSMIPILVSLR